MKFNNVLIFKQRPSTGSAADYQIGMALTAWLIYVVAYTRNPQTADFHVPVVSTPPEYRPGKTYLKWLKMGVLEHISGFDFANHFVKLPLSWLSETYSTETTIDEEGAEITVTITNEEHYKQGLVKNDTDCLVKITDENFSELEQKITYDSDLNPTNTYNEAVYFAAIAEGGEFYKAPDTDV